MSFVADLFDIREQEEIRLEELYDDLDLDLRAIRDKLTMGFNDVISTIYDTVLEEATDYFEEHNIKLYQYNISVYSNYSDTQFDVANNMANELEKDIALLALDENDYDDMPPNVKWFLNKVLGWNLRLR